MRHRRLIATLLLFSLPLAGCWDFRGLEGRAFAIMAGIDRTEEGLFRMSIQIQLATAGQPGGGGGGGGGSAGGPSNYRVVVGEGETIRMAFARARGLISRELDVAILDTIVFGESAVANLEDLEIFVRSLRVPVTAYVAVARGDAETVVRASTPGFQVPGEYTLQGFRGTWTRSPYVVRAPVWALFNRDFHSPLEDPYAQALTAEKYGLNWDGMALFRYHAFVGFLSPDDATIFNMVENQQFERTVEVNLGEDRRASLVIQRGKVRKWVTWERNQPVLHVHIKGAGDLFELTGMTMRNTEVQFELESAFSKKLADEITALLKLLQEMNVDPFGFGELARRASPYRPDVQSSDAWHATYQQAKLDVQARLSIVSSGYVQ